ncbi:MAG TPA: Uma2 family endonuclease [Pyrinomonadaceae bacterium]
MVSNIVPLMTIADLEAMPADDGNRYELIEGELYVSSAPGLTHQIVSDNIVHLMRTYLDQNPMGIAVSTIGLILSNYNGVIPDIVFFSHEEADQIVSNERLYSAPSLVIEILSAGAGNLHRDRVAKHQLYQKYAVKEYWIVDRDERVIEIYRLKSKVLQSAAKATGDDEITTPILPGFACSTQQIFSLP